MSTFEECFKEEIESINLSEIYTQDEKNFIINRARLNYGILDSFFENKKWLEIILNEIGLEGLVNSGIEKIENPKQLRIKMVRSFSCQTYTSKRIPLSSYGEDYFDLIGTSMLIDLSNKNNMEVRKTGKIIGLKPYLKDCSDSSVQLDYEKIREDKDNLGIDVRDTQLIFDSNGKETMRAELSYKDRINPSSEIYGNPSTAPIICKEHSYYSKDSVSKLALTFGVYLTTNIPMFNIKTCSDVRKRMYPYVRGNRVFEQYEDGFPEKLLMNAIKYCLTVAVASGEEFEHPDFRDIKCPDCKDGYVSMVSYYPTDMNSEITGIGWGFSYEGGNSVRSKEQACENAKIWAENAATSKLKVERNYLSQAGGGRK